MASNNPQPAKSKKQLANLRQYQSIWEAIKTKQPGVIVPVRCHPTAVARIIQAVKKEKSREVAVKKKIAMPRAGLLVVAHNPEFVDGKATGMSIINFSLAWDGSKL